MLCSATNARAEALLNHVQVWKSSTAIDSFSIGYELKKKRSDVRGTLPRAEHGTVWQSIDTLDAYSVFNEDVGEEAEGGEDEHDVCGLIPTDHELR